MKISAANRAGTDAHQQLRPARLWLGHIAQLQGLVRFVENHGTHARSLNDERRMTNEDLMTKFECPRRAQSAVPSTFSRDCETTINERRLGRGGSLPSANLACVLLHGRGNARC